ncbi:hypothetical protein FRC07_010619 [Ceratobasidium sp. 392]|nr:hypothetical protein FRC07_010619 [Ceratobasidium sp. 392]
MKLVDKLSRHSSNTPYFSLELFPSQDRTKLSNLLTRINGLADLKPIAVSVTWGAGGSTRGRSLELAAGFCQANNGLDTILHLTCTNMEKGPVDEVLTHAEDLVTHIMQHPTFSSHFCIGVAGEVPPIDKIPSNFVSVIGYPDGHSDGGTEDEQSTYLKRKVDAGAEFVVTQSFYDVDRFKSWLGNVRARGITVPVIPEVMPLQTYVMFTRMKALFNATVPEHIQIQLDAIEIDS